MIKDELKSMIIERYYWKKEDGTMVPVHELTNSHICNIVMKFGKDRLREMGHSVIADKFENLSREYKFFNVVKDEFKKTEDSISWDDE